MLLLLFLKESTLSLGVRDHCNESKCVLLQKSKFSTQYLGLGCFLASNTVI